MGNHAQKGSDHSTDEQAWSSLKLSLEQLPDRDNRLSLAEGSLNLSSIDETWKVKFETVLELPRSLRVLDLSNTPWIGAANQETLLPKLRFICELKLNGCELRFLSASVSQLRSLQKLWISSNSLTRLPEELSALKSLRYLDCSQNQLKELPSGLFSCPLETLILNKNEFHAISPQIGQLTSLTTLNLSDNFLEALPVEIGKLQSLRKFYIDHNELHELPEAFSQLTALKELNISNNQIASFPSSITKLTKLSQFDVSDNLISISPQQTSDIPSLLAFLSQIKPAKTASHKHRLRSESNLAKPQVSATGSKPTEFLVVENKKRLLQFIGKKDILVRYIALNTKALNHGASHLLDSGKNLYLWFGAQANPRTQAKARYFAQKMNEDISNTSQIVVVDTDDTESEFWKVITGDKSNIKPASDAEDIEATARLSTKLFRFSEASGRLDIRGWMGEKLSKDMLDASATYVLDCNNQIFVWIGTFSSNSERTWAMLKAEELVAQSWRSSCAEIFWLLDGHESWLFRDQFVDWADKNWEELVDVSPDTPQRISAVPKSKTFSGYSKSALPPPNSNDPSELSEEDKALLRKMEEANRWLQTERQRLSAKQKQKRNSLEEKSISVPSLEVTPPPAQNVKDYLESRRSSIIHRNLTVSTLAANKQPEQEKATPTAPQSETAFSENLPSSLSTGALPSATSERLGTTQRAKPKLTGRRLPQQNPIRNRSEREHEDDLYRVSQGITRGSSAPSSASTLGVGAQLGGFGLLYALKPDKEATTSQLRPRTGSASGQRPSEPRLIQVYGRRNIFVRQLPITIESLQMGGCFLLDTGKGEGLLYQWNVPGSNRIEKGKAMDVAKSIKDKERNGLAKVILVDQEQEKESKFWSYFGLSEKPATLTSVQTSPLIEREVWETIQLFQVLVDKQTDPTGEKLETMEVGRGKIYKEMLLEDSCYILDAVTEMYVWCGKKAPLKVKNGVIKLAQAWHDDKDFWTVPMLREFPGSESVLFREKFCNWGTLPIQMQQVPVGLNTAPTPIQRPINVLELHNTNNRRTSTVLIDDGLGKIKVWKVDDFKRVEVPEKMYGEFYSGESYIILYTYVWKNKDCHLIYFWQGRRSRVQEKGSSALLTIQLDDELNREAKEVRVIQNKEPEHFSRIFKGKFLVHYGRDENGEAPATQMWQVHGEHDWDVKAVQIPAKSCMLSSRSSFVVVKGEVSFVWHGMAASEHEREFAEHIAAFGNPDRVIYLIEEGNESPAFWEALGGQGTYWVRHNRHRFTPRLFQCSVGSGTFTVEECYPFTQDDLSTDDVFILDAYEEVFVWVGDKCDPKELRKAMETALEYQEKAPDKRDKDTTRLYCVFQGKETLQFTTHFHGWDFGNASPEIGSLPLVVEMLKEYTRTYTYEELIGKQFPKGFDTTQLETYLSNEEFVRVFNVTREQFAKFPVWKAHKIKRSLGLY